MAKAVGISPSSVRRIWKRHGLQPHRVRSFKLSNDPKFAEKFKEVVGLYIDPPAHAVVLSIDEKSQIQALDRAQPGLPMKKGRCATITNDYKRNGTTTLFAALDILEGKVIGRCMQRHRHQEFIRFLNAVERQMPADKALHVVLDNYATHKRVLGPTRSKVGLPGSPGNASSAVSSPRSSSSRPPSTASSPRPTTNPSHSSGPNPPKSSSPPSSARDKR
jgi:DDE superfamily endonuclease